MKRTTNSYDKRHMFEKDYDRDYEKLEKELANLEQTPIMKNNKIFLKDLSKSDISSVYNDLDRENKQAFWHNIIDKIEIGPMHYKEGSKYIIVGFLN